jgi:pimeloyl-ACP methyl ester carboxylesterase
VREVAGPPGAPTVVLLHGWVASGGLNWFRAFEPLSEHFRVVAVDLRGHSRGLRTRRVFRLADCADDTAATLEELGTGPAIAVGYSMGGPIAQLLWRRHRDLVSGLVLCATAGGFMPGARERILYQSMMAAAVTATRFGSIANRLPGVPRVAPFALSRPGTLPAWAAAELRRHDWRMLLEAGHSLGTYHAGRWLPEIDVPTAVVLTTDDAAVAPGLQYKMAMAIPGATVHPLDDGHLACARDEFGASLSLVCHQVADRT